MRIEIKSFKKNEGIALIIALIFLFVSTLLGITSLRSNILSEKMTLNAIQRVEAFEVAEATLLEAELLVESSNQLLVAAVLNSRVPTSEALDCESIFDSQGGICVPIEATPSYDGSAYDHWHDYEGDTNSNNVWTNTDRHRSLDNPALMNSYNLNNAPKYIIEFMGFGPSGGNDDNSICSASGGADPTLQSELFTWPFCSLDRSIYRITALATTGNYDETRVMLQSTYVVEN